MNMTHADTPPTAPGQHLGPLPASPDVAADIQAMNAAGYWTCLASTWAAAELAGLEPAELRGWAQ